MNRAKVKRFHERNPDYFKDRKKLKKLNNPTYRTENTGAFRTYELIDPRDEDRFPRVVGYCPKVVRPVWSNLWAVRAHSTSRWAEWFRELDALGLTPLERFGWALGLTLAINIQLSQSLVLSRVHRIGELTTGDPCKLPPWLLRPVEWTEDRPVARLHADGRVERFRSLAEARKLSGVDQFIIKHWVHVASTGRDGCIWFDD